MVIVSSGSTEAAKFAQFIGIEFECEFLRGDLECLPALGILVAGVHVAGVDPGAKSTGAVSWSCAGADVSANCCFASRFVRQV
jgi:hypothetical protein